MDGGVSMVDGHIDGPKCCENCLYYDTDRADQPCCSCVDSCNYKKSEVQGE